MGKEKLSILALITLVVPTLVIALFSTRPSYEFNLKSSAALVVSFKKTSQRIKLCDEAERKAFLKRSAKRRKHMQSARRECGSRERLPIRLKVRIDAQDILDKLIDPSGVRNDGIVYTYEIFKLNKGKHVIEVATTDYREGETGFSHTIAEEVTFGGRQIIVIDYDQLFIKDDL